MKSIDSKNEFKRQFAGRIKTFVLNLIRFIEQLPADRTSKVIGDQLLRSGTSIGANYFEARAAVSRNDFANFFSHALKSANESQFWLEILIETEKGNVKDASDLLQEVGEIARVLARGIITVKEPLRK